MWRWVNLFIRFVSPNYTFTYASIKHGLFSCRLFVRVLQGQLRGCPSLSHRVLIWSYCSPHRLVHLGVLGKTSALWCWNARGPIVFWTKWRLEKDSKIEEVHFRSSSWVRSYWRTSAFGTWFQPPYDIHLARLPAPSASVIRLQWDSHWRRRIMTWYAPNDFYDTRGARERIMYKRMYVVLVPVSFYILYSWLRREVRSIIVYLRRKVQYRSFTHGSIWFDPDHDFEECLLLLKLGRVVSATRIISHFISVILLNHI